MRDTKITFRVPAVKFPGGGWDYIEDISDLPVVSTKNICVRDVLLLPVGDEIVIVKKINYSKKTIDLYCRGYGSTTSHRQGIKPFEVKIIDNLSKEWINRMMTPIGCQK